MSLDKALEDYLSSAESTLKEILRDFYVERYKERLRPRREVAISLESRSLLFCLSFFPRCDRI